MRATLRSSLPALSLALAALLPAAASAEVHRTTVDGPSATLDSGATGTTAVEVDTAPDGTAAIAYLKQVAGVSHVFVSRYVGGGWSGPEQVDAGLANQGVPSSAPALSVGNGGRVVVAFVNGPPLQGSIWAVVKPSAGTPLGSPHVIKPFGGGIAYSGPNVELAPNGNGYLTFYSSSVNGQFLYGQRIEGDTFSQVGTGLLNQDLTHQAAPGEQTGARIGVDATGVTGTVAWAEGTGGTGTQVWARKLTGTATGPAVDARIATFNGHANDDGQNNDIDVATGGGTTWVAQHVSFAYPGGSSRARVFARTFDGTTFGPPTELDGIGDADDNAELVRLAVNGSGQGIGVSYRGKNVSVGSEASLLSGTTWSTPAAIAAPNVATAARPTAAIDDNGVAAAATYSVPSTGATPQLVARIYGGTANGTLSTLSDPAFGDVSPAVESGAGAGSFITAFVQGSGATSRIVAAVVDLPVPAPTPAPLPTPVPTRPPVACPAVAGGAAGTACGGLPVPLRFGDFKLRGKTIARSTGAPSLVSATSSKRVLSFNLLRPATITLTLSRLTVGRMSGSKCVAQTSKNRKAKACTKATPVKGSAVLKAPAGPSGIAFGGSLTKGKLAATGRYQLTLAAKDAFGSVADPVVATYTLKAAPKKTRTAKKK